MTVELEFTIEEDSSLCLSIKGTLTARIYSCTCQACGDDLRCSADVDSDNDVTLGVEPCGKCMDSAEEAGDAEGYTRGVAEGETP